MLRKSAFISVCQGSRFRYHQRTAAILQEFGEDGLKLAEKYGDDLARIIDNLEPTEAKKAVSLINSYGDDALEMFKEGKSFDEVKKVVEGGRKTPSEIARSWQGKGKYPGIDDYVDITVKKGTVLYRGEPNGTEYFTTLDAIEQSGRDATKLFEGLQVEKNPKYGYRGEMQGYVFNEDVASAYGIANANPQFGKGGLPQYYVPDVQDLIDKGILTPVDNIKLNK